MSIQWQVQKDHSFKADIGTGVWTLYAHFYDELDPMARRYYLIKPNSEISEVRTMGGIYTALDIAEQVIATYWIEKNA